MLTRRKLFFSAAEKKGAAGKKLAPGSIVFRIPAAESKQKARFLAAIFLGLGKRDCFAGPLFLVLGPKSKQNKFPMPCLYIGCKRAARPLRSRDEVLVARLGRSCKCPLRSRDEVRSREAGEVL